MCEHQLEIRTRVFTSNLKNTKLDVGHEPERARPPPTSGPPDRPTDPPPEPPPRTDPRSQGPGAPAREATRTSQAQPTRPTPPAPRTRAHATPHASTHPDRRATPPTTTLTSSVPQFIGMDTHTLACRGPKTLTMIVGPHGNPDPRQPNPPPNPTPALRSAGGTHARSPFGGPWQGVAGASCHRYVRSRARQ